MRPIQLQAPEVIEAYWPFVEPLLDECTNKLADGEYTTEDLKHLTVSGQFQTMVVVNDWAAPPSTENVELVIVYEASMYPRKQGLNIVALGGRDLKGISEKFWGQFTNWAFMNGAQFIEGWVAPAMQRVLERRMGFKKVSTLVRYDLESMNDS